MIFKLLRTIAWPFYWLAVMLAVWVCSLWGVTYKTMTMMTKAALINLGNIWSAK
jgi:hypothetical protein